MNKTSLTTLERAKHLLPDSMLEIIDVIGFENAVAVVEAVGGRSYPIARSVEKSDYIRRIVDAIGEDAAQDFCNVFGGQGTHYVPKCEAAILYLRNEEFKQAVFDAIEAGESKTSAVLRLCGQYGLSDRIAWNILKNTMPSQQRNLL